MRAVVVAVLIAGTVGPVWAVDMPEFPFVFAYGTAMRDVPPDMARVEVQLETYSTNSTSALSLLHQRSYDVASMLATNGIAEGDITAFDIRKTIVRKREDYEEREIIGYRFQRGFKIVIRDLKAYKRIVGMLRAMPNTENIDSKFDSKDRDTISQQLIQEAALDAHNRASELAVPFGATVGTVHAVSEQGFSDLGLEFGMGELHEITERMRMYQMGDPFGGQKEDILFLPSTIRFQERITALFRLEVADEESSNKPAGR